MQYTIHLKPVLGSAEILLEQFKIVKFLSQKKFKVESFHHKRMIKFHSDNPGIISHLKRLFGKHIVCILSDKHGAGQFKRPASRLTPRGLFGPHAKPLTPLQVAKAYNFPKPGPSIRDKVVAFIELGGAYDVENVYKYCQQLGVPGPSHIYNHLVDGATLVSDPNGADGEVSLDLCVAVAVAPGIKALVVFAPNTSNGFIDAVAGMSTYKLVPDAVSISWGMPESAWDPGAREAMDNAIQSCINKGINVFVAAGDNGSSDGAAGLNVDYPASSPFAIACGGTELYLNPDGTRLNEVVWNEQFIGEGATGGGKSVAYPNRSVPDISGNADPRTGYEVDVNGTASVIGGTSAVAPLFAGLTALLASNLSKPVGSLIPVLYKNPGVCFDVIKGNNGFYQASVGYDECTGLGVPDGQKLLALLQPPVSQKIINFLAKPVSQLFS